MLPFVIQVKLVDQGTDWAAWVAAIASALTFGFVAVTAWLAWRGLRNARRTRHGQLIVEVSGLWDDQRVISSSRHFRSRGSDKTTQLVETLWAPGRETRYDLDSDEGLADYETDLEDWYDLSIYPNLIDAIGVLSAEEALTVAVVDRMWGSNIIDAWGAMEATRCPPARADRRPRGVVGLRRRFRANGGVVRVNFARA